MLIVRFKQGITRSALLVLFILAWTPRLAANVSVSSDSATLAWQAHTDPAVTGYIVYYGTSSGTYPMSVNVGNVTTTELTSLTQGVQYFAAVTAYNQAQQQSLYSNEVCFTLNGGSPGNGGQLILLEPEEGDLVEPMYIGVEFDPSDFVLSLGPESTYVSPLETTQTGTITLNFDAPEAGDYAIWCRVKAPTSGSDSFFYSIDGGPEQVYSVYGFSSPSNTTYSEDWIWSRIDLPSGEPARSTLSQGSHTLVFRNREADIKLEAVALSSDPAFVPANTLAREGDVVIITTRMNSRSVDAGETVSLSVTTTSTGSATYEWYKDGVLIEGANDAILNIFDFQEGDIGSYSVVASSGSVSATSESAMISLLPPPYIESMDVFVVGPSRFVLMDIDGHLGSTIEVYGSSDLANWELLDTQVNEGGSIAVNDPAAVLAPSRYYQLVIP